MIDFFRNCIKRGANPVKVAQALRLANAHMGNILTAFADIGGYERFEAALANC